MKKIDFKNEMKVNIDANKSTRFDQRILLNLFNDGKQMAEIIAGGPDATRTSGQLEVLNA